MAKSLTEQTVDDYAPYVRDPETHRAWINELAERLGPVVSIENRHSVISGVLIARTYKFQNGTEYEFTCAMTGVDHF